MLGIFNYIELFYNSARRHGNNNDLSPMDYEQGGFLKRRDVSYILSDSGCSSFRATMPRPELFLSPSIDDGIREYFE